MSKNLTLVDIYRSYKAEGGELPKSVFKNVCQDFNNAIMNFIIYDAGTFNMGSNLSTLSVGKIKRNFNKPSIDWKASNEYKQELLDAGEKLYDPDTKEGTKWLIYYDTDWYCRFYWQKKNAKFKNKEVYEFVPTRGKVGNKRKLKDHLRENDINYVKYRNLSS